MVNFNIPLEYAHLNAAMNIKGSVNWDELKLNRFKELSNERDRTEEEDIEFCIMWDEIWDNCEYELMDYEMEDWGPAMYDDGVMIFEN